MEPFKDYTDFVLNELRSELFCVNIVNLDCLISISNMGTFKFADQCLIPQLKLSLQWSSMLDPKIQKTKFRPLTQNNEY